MIGNIQIQRKLGSKDMAPNVHIVLHRATMVSLTVYAAGTYMTSCAFVCLSTVWVVKILYVSIP